MISVARRAGIAVTLAVLICAGCSESVPTTEDAAEYAEEYVRVINAQDQGELKELLNNPMWPDDASKRIAAADGATWTAGDPVVVMLTEGAFNVTIPVSADGKTESWELAVGTHDGKLVTGPLE